MHDKIALRVVQNAYITLDGVRVPEENRLQRADSFRETAAVLRLTRAGVAWQAVGCAMGAYEHALAYATAARAVRPADRGFPAGAGPAGADAGNITSSACHVRPAVPAAGRGGLAEDHSALAKAFCTVRMRETVG